MLSGIGPFAGLFALGSKYRDPVLVSSTDGVGTKVKLAALVGRYEGARPRHRQPVCVNDALTTGAEPLFFLDYIASADLTPDAQGRAREGHRGRLRGGWAARCSAARRQTCRTSTRRASSTSSASSSASSSATRSSTARGSSPGDLLFGLPSNGLHTNGYSLARPALGIGMDAASADADRERLERYEPELGETLADALLRPHTLLRQRAEARALRLIKGMSHITGGGFEENLPRMLPDGLGARFEQGSVAGAADLPLTSSARAASKRRRCTASSTWASASCLQWRRRLQDECNRWCRARCWWVRWSQQVLSRVSRCANMGHVRVPLRISGGRGARGAELMRALLAPNDKTGLAELATGLKGLGWEVAESGGGEGCDLVALNLKPFDGGRCGRRRGAGDAAGRGSRYESVIVLCDPADYEATLAALKAGGVTKEQRRRAGGEGVPARRPLRHAGGALPAGRRRRAARRS